MQNSLFRKVLSVLLFLPILVSGQNTHSITGQVVDQDELPVESATIYLNEGRQTTTDRLGNFAFKGIPDSTFTLFVKALGYQDKKLQMSASGIQTHEGVIIILERGERRLEEIEVFGQSETSKVKNQTVRAIVVDTREVQEQPATLSEIMNRSPGIRIRQSGGLGNTVDLSINGFQSNSVQYFKDGIPLEYLGGSYGLNSVPLNLLDRVEVYKGIVPVTLGGDALGGAVNLVTVGSDTSYFTTSYEISSFHTHIGNLSLKHVDKEGRSFAGIEVFYNYSLNDYKVDVMEVDETSNLQSIRVPLFHNSYKQHFVEGFVGVKNRKWTDELKFSLVNYNMDRATQHPTLMTVPYGAVMVNNKGWVPNIRYKKSLLDNKVKIDQFLSSSFINRSRVDTIRGSYDWYGHFTPGNNVGESPNASLSDINFFNLMNRTNLIYQFTPMNKIEFNFVYNKSSRVGEDPYGLRFTGTDIDILSKDAVYSKVINGFMWESKWLNNRLTSQSTLKHFYFYTRGINGFRANATDLESYKTFDRHNWGASEALKYEISDRSLVRGAIELTNRLPRDFEIFGDNDTRAPNFQLKPEESVNINLAYRYGNPKWSFEASTFYRKTRGLILLVPIQSPFAQYQNLDNVRGYGFDLDGRYNINETVWLTGNMSWQDNRMIDIEEGLHKWIEGTRLRNTPYFFSNLGIQGAFTSFISHKDNFRPYLHWNFIREFYLNHIPRDKEPKGILGLFGKANVPVTNIIPNQHLLSAGFTYHFTIQGLSLGAEVKNLTDAKLFDYYKIQRPGRSFHLKLTYILKK